ncbi:hypothetical protein KQI84_11155 [bacterium]|nr:hypothetical protein [bacterium]
MSIRFPRIRPSLVTAGLIGTMTLSGVALAALPQEAAKKEAPSIQWTTLNQTNNLYPGATYFLRAKLNSVINPGPQSERPCWLQLADETGTRQVRVDRDTWNNMKFHDEIQPGTFVEIFVKGKDAGERVDLVLPNAWNIKILDGQPTAEESEEPEATPRAAVVRPITVGPTPTVTPIPGGASLLVPEPISAIASKAIGSDARVRGMVTNIVEPRSETAPVRVDLQDDSGTIHVVYWSNVADAMNAETRPEIGATLEVLGEVDIYQGETELRVNAPNNISKWAEVAMR